MSTLSIVLALCSALSVHGYKTFQTYIPNGENVPHPCRPNYLWQGVGHFNKQGGGARNPFGVDFYNAGMQWTEDLCQKDSDGDGKTNGEELGDPQCVWTKGQAPDVIQGLSHPGVCEPFDSELCKGKNDGIDCSTPGFKCDALDREDSNDLVNVTLRFPETKVPSVETTYYCMTFDLPQDRDYHLIATQPIIDNVNVMHHILVFGCEDGAGKQETPGTCNMGQCFTMIGGWTVGAYGECVHEKAGFLIGKTGFKRVRLEFHWNNPMFVPDYTDSSGIMLHLTKNMRMNNMGIFMTGQSYLQLAPGEDRIYVDGHCTPEATRRRLKGPIHFVSAINHMHYLGRYMRMEHYRNGVKLSDLTYEENYSYDSPKAFGYDKSVEFLAGDELKVTCGFRTKDRSKTVFSGDGTSDEMCYGFLSFYPVENTHTPYCIKWKNLDTIEFYISPVINNCNYRDFMNTTHPETVALHRKVTTHCGYLGQCREECFDVIAEVKRHPCMQGDIHDWLRDQARTNPAYIQMALLFSSIDSCNKEVVERSCPRPNVISN